MCKPQYAGQEWQNFYERVINDRIQHVQQLKHDGTTTVYRAEIQDICCVVKRYNTKNTWHFTRRALRQSRAINCWELAHNYLSVGIETPRPIAMIQAQNGPFKRRSWYICANQPGHTLTHAIQHRPDANTLGIWPQRLNELFGKMLDHRLSHGDFKATNLITHQNRLIIIDLDAARCHRSTTRHIKALSKDYLRFMQNWADDSIALSDFRTALEPIESALQNQTKGESYDQKTTPD